MHKPRQYDAEACDLFLACIIEDPAWLPIFLDRVGEDDLPLSQGLVWKTVVQAYLDKAEPTVLEILHRLENTPRGAQSALDVVGREYIESLPGMLATAGVRDTKKIRLFLERIEKSSEKALIQELRESAERAFAKTGLDFDSWWNIQTALVIERRQKRQGVGAKQIGDFYADLDPAIEAWFQGQTFMRVPTGWPKLDGFIGGGLLKRALTVIAGPPSSGKTTCALIWSLNQARAGLTVGWSSLEMTGDMLLLRLACIMAGINWTDLMSGRYKGNPVARDALDNAKREIKTLPLYIDDRGDITTEDVHWQVLRMFQMHRELDVWYIDYADRLKNVNPDELARVRNIVRESKNIAKLLGIALVLLSQITKRSELSDSKLPTAADMRYAGHDDADWVMMPWDIHRYYRIGEVSVAKGVRDAEGMRIDPSESSNWYLNIAKGRLSDVGILRFDYNRAFGQITDPTMPAVVRSF